MTTITFANPNAELCILCDCGAPMEADGQSIVGIENDAGEGRNVVSIDLACHACGRTVHVLELPLNKPKPKPCNGIHPYPPCASLECWHMEAS